MEQRRVNSRSQAPARARNPLPVRLSPNTKLLLTGIDSSVCSDREGVSMRRRIRVAVRATVRLKTKANGKARRIVVKK